MKKAQNCAHSIAHWANSGTPVYHSELKQLGTSLFKKLIYLEGVDIVANDILEHNVRLEAVLKRAEAVDLRLNPNKSQIFKTEVPYVGHLLTHGGLKLNPDRVQAILEIKTPNNKQAVHFLGMLG